MCAGHIYLEAGCDQCEEKQMSRYGSLCGDSRNVISLVFCGG